MNKLFSYFLFLIFSGCANSKIIADSPVPEALQKEVISTWEGILPCADCEEIHYTLSLLPDGKYVATSIYMGKSAEELKVSGTWELSADSLLTLTEKNLTSVYLFDGNKLIMMDGNGQKITSSSEEMVHLQRFVSEVSAAFWNKKMLAGVNFTASGNEPFWSLDIKFDSSIHFITMAGREFTASIGRGVEAADANVTHYRSVTENGEILLQLFKQNCMDDISGAKNSYQVKVQVKTAGDTEYTVYNGCGKYIGDYRLHDIWALQSIGNKVIDPKEFQNGIPTIEFQLNEGKTYGFGGCNRFFGKIHLEDGAISFSQVGSTEMACPGLHLETEFLSTFSDKTLSYKVMEGILNLGEGENRLVFKKVD